LNQLKNLSSLGFLSMGLEYKKYLKAQIQVKENPKKLPRQNFDLDLDKITLKLMIDRVFSLISCYNSPEKEVFFMDNYQGNT
jgi:hypothetical protein